MITKELVDFIKAEQTKGKSEEEIKTLLIQNGWNEGDIKEGFEPMNENIVSQEEEDEMLLSIGQIVFFMGLILSSVLVFFFWYAGGGNKLGGLGFILILVAYWIPTLIFLVMFLITFILSLIYGIKLLKRGYELWGILNLLFPVLILMYIMFGVLANSFN